MVAKLVPQIAGVTRQIGVRRKRTEDPLLLMGKATFTDDIHLPGMVAVAFLRSAHAHADLKKVDLQRAKSHPGCIRIFTSAEVHGGTVTFFEHQGNMQPVGTPFFAGEKVRFVGEIIAAVVASDRYIAEDIVDLIQVEYEPHPVVVDVEKAMEAKQWDELIHEEIIGNVYFSEQFEKGDWKKAFKEADLIVKEKVTTARVSAVPMETRAVLATWDWDDTLTVWSSTQVPFLLRTHIAGCLGIPEQNIRVIAPHVGGGFGQKCTIYPEEFILPWIAKDIRKPVKWIEDRREHLISAAHAKQTTNYVEVALKKDGTILAVKNKSIGDSGAYSIYPWSGIIDPAVANTTFPGAFTFQNIQYESIAALTNK